MGSKKEADEKMKAFADIGVVHINVQLCDHDTRTKDAVKVARAVVKAGKKHKVTPAIEIHRDTCTETPEKAYALADAYRKKYKKKLRMNFDHSHPAIIKQLRPNEYWERLSERTDLLQMHELIPFSPLYGQPLSNPGDKWQRAIGSRFQNLVDELSRTRPRCVVTGRETGQNALYCTRTGTTRLWIRACLFPRHLAGCHSRKK